MKKEYVLIAIIGLYIAAYVLEAIVQPLNLDLATPYHYIDSQYLSTYPFTTTAIIIRAIAVWATPLWIMSFIEKKYGLKASIAFVLAGLSQLYVLQELATGNQILPLEWALAVALAGIAMLPVLVIYIIQAGLSSAYSKLTGNKSVANEESEYVGEEEDIE